MLRVSIHAVKTAFLDLLSYYFTSFHVGHCFSKLTAAPSLLPDSLSGILLLLSAWDSSKLFLFVFLWTLGFLFSVLLALKSFRTSIIDMKPAEPSYFALCHTRNPFILILTLFQQVFLTLSSALNIFLCSILLPSSSLVSILYRFKKTIPDLSKTGKIRPWRSLLTDKHGTSGLCEVRTTPLKVSLIRFQNLVNPDERDSRATWDFEHPVCNHLSTKKNNFGKNIICHEIRA